MKTGRTATAISSSSAMALEPLSEAAHNDANKVRGCVSQVWLEKESRVEGAGATMLHYRGDSDSHLVRGLIAIAIALFSDQPPKRILAIDALGDVSRARPRPASHPAAIERRSRHDRPHSIRRRRCSLATSATGLRRFVCFPRILARGNAPMSQHRVAASVAKSAVLFRPQSVIEAGWTSAGPALSIGWRLCYETGGRVRAPRGRGQ